MPAPDKKPDPFRMLMDLQRGHGDFIEIPAEPEPEPRAIGGSGDGGRGNSQHVEPDPHEALNRAIREQLADARGWREIL